MIAVVDYGIGNLRSAQKAIGRVGGDARLTSDPDAVASADAVVLPGVGHFGRCATALEETDLGPAVIDAIARGIPFLGICVGFQLLFEGSDEDPKARGLSVLSGVVRGLSGYVKRPQMQWNRLDRTRTGVDSRMLGGLGESPWVYFVHSYAPVPEGNDAGSVVATCDYGSKIAAAVENGMVWGTQFHPEKSSRTGLALLSNFVAIVS